MASPHDFAKGRVFEICQPGSAGGIWQKQIPQARRTCLRLQFLDDFCRLPAIALHLFVKAPLVGINVLIHKALNMLLQFLGFLAVFECHWNGFTLPAGEGGGTLLEKVCDALLEIFALQARQHFALGNIEMPRSSVWNIAS